MYGIHFYMFYDRPTHGIETLHENTVNNWRQRIGTVAESFWITRLYQILIANHTNVFIYTCSENMYKYIRVICNYCKNA